MSDLVVWTPNPVGLLEEAEKAKARSASFSGIGGDGSDLGKENYINIDFGMTITRLLPSWRKPDHPLVNQAPFVRVVDHVRIPPNNKYARCWRETYPNECMAKGVECPVCAEKKRLIDDGILASYNDFKGMPYQKTVYNTNGYDRKREDGKARIIGVPQKPWPTMLETISNWIKTFNINVYDPIKGRDLVIHKDGTRNGPIRDIGYRLEFLPADSPICAIPGTLPPQPDIEKMRGVLEHLWDIDVIYKFPSEKKFDEKYAELRAAATELSNHYRSTGAGKMYAAAVVTQQAQQPYPQQPQLQPPQQQQQQQQKIPASQMAPITVTGMPISQPAPVSSAYPACYSNIDENYEPCRDCTYEIACRHQQKEKGKDTSKPLPQQVFPMAGAGAPDDSKPY